NDSGHTLGMACRAEAGGCFWTLMLSVECKKDQNYPILASSGDGAVSLEAKCGGKLDADYLYFFTDFDQIEKVIRAGNRVGFVVPMEDNEFGSLRFSLRGAADALLAAQKAFSERLKFAPKNIPKSTKDQRL